MWPLGLVEAHDAVEPLHVEQDGIAAELLAAHRVPAAGDADGPPFPPGVSQSCLDRVEGRRLDDPVDARGVQLGLHVVDFDSRGLVRRLAVEAWAGSAIAAPRLGRLFEELTACRHSNLLKAFRHVLAALSGKRVWFD